MSLVDRPLVQYAIDEARDAGITEFIFVTSRGKGALEDYFDQAPQLESALTKNGKNELLAEVQKTNMDSGEIVYVRQNVQLGLGHAVWCARRLVGNEPFAVILPDDVIGNDKPCLTQMIEAYEETGGNMVAAMDVPPEQASSYGLLDIARTNGRVLSVRGMVEKPKPEDAPSNTAVIGRYILTPPVLRNLNQLKKGNGGEIQLTDAIAAEIQRSGNVYGYRFQGKRYDCGSKIGFIKATVAFGLAREDLRDELRDYLKEITETGGDSG